MTASVVTALAPRGSITGALTLLRDDGTLRSDGFADFDGALDFPFSAHPKAHARTIDRLCA